MKAMNRIQTCFTRLGKRAAFIPYIVAGDPDLVNCLTNLLSLVEAGADIIELGVPFSDPVADGPINQAGMQRALQAGITLQGVLALVQAFRQHDQQTPVVLMSYLNPIEIFGYSTFAEQAAVAGVDGVLIVDCPAEEAQVLQTVLVAQQLAMIYLLAPTTSTERIGRICQQASGYLYYVSLKGITGTKSIDTDAIEQQLATIRELTDLPICVGFGIKTAQAAQAVAKLADGVVVGSVLVDSIGQQDKPALQQLATELASAIHGE